MNKSVCRTGLIRQMKTLLTNKTDEQLYCVKLDLFRYFFNFDVIRVHYFYFELHNGCHHILIFSKL